MHYYSFMEFVKDVINQFAIYGQFESVKPFGTGHINSTYQSVWDQGGVKLRYTHQRINEKVFIRPDEVMENIDRVTGHIRECAKREGKGDYSRSTLHVVPSKDGKLWARDAEGGWWRTYLFVERSHTLEVTDSPDDARFLGESIAHFQSRLATLGGKRLHETIVDFHNMESRYKKFYDALKRDPCNRAKDVKKEIAFMEENEERGAILIRSVRSGALPERICHNDAKMNNILIDDENGEALCVIDLDTVMPGTALFDVGDLIRTVTNRGAEDEKDLSKVEFDLVYFEALLEGYFRGAKDFLVPSEYALVCESGRNLTHLMGLRFLTDYIDGDHYYRISRPDHNIDRSRTQITLMRSMDSKWEAAAAIAEKLR